MYSTWKNWAASQYQPFSPTRNTLQTRATKSPCRINTITVQYVHLSRSWYFIITLQATSHSKAQLACWWLAFITPLYKKTNPETDTWSASGLVDSPLYSILMCQQWKIRLGYQTEDFFFPVGFSLSLSILRCGASLCIFPLQSLNLLCISNIFQLMSQATTAVFLF